MEVAQIKAYVPKSLKRRAFSAFATLDLNFSRWTREQLEKWLDAHQAQVDGAIAADVVDTPDARVCAE
jgi:hypothetical protein